MFDDNDSTEPPHAASTEDPVRDGEQDAHSGGESAPDRDTEAGADADAEAGAGAGAATARDAGSGRVASVLASLRSLFDRRNPWRAPAMAACAVFAGSLLLYAGDVLLSQGDVARGTVVAGVDVGGLDRAEAELRLRETLEPRTRRPVRLRAADVRHTIDPGTARLSLDWEATLDRATEQPLNPFARLASLFTRREIGVVSHADQGRFDSELRRLAAVVDRQAREGDVRFDGIRPVAVDPAPGRRLDRAKTRELVLRHWVSPGPLRLPVTTVPVRSTPDSVRAALRRIAEPAVSGPVTVHADGKDVSLSPRQIAQALHFDVDRSGSLQAAVDAEALTESLGPRLADTEKPGRDAGFEFEGDQVTVRPSQPGRTVDWQALAKDLLPVLRGGEQRQVGVRYAERPAELTTSEAHELGIVEVIGEFTTGGFAYDSGINIRRVAQEVNGAVVKPGQTFSLNGHTGPRGLEQGYVYAGIISGGKPGRAVGGGISQFATTLYNAAYFAGMRDTEHTEHSYYISRYPQGREATVFQNPDGSSVIDLKFTNDAPTGVVIQTRWTPSDITVRLWGTKRYEVESVTGGRFNYTAPPTTVLPEAECSPSSGTSGFTTTDTRIIRDADTGAEIRREKRTVVYRGQPRVVCEEPEPDPEPSPASPDEAGDPTAAPGQHAAGAGDAGSAQGARGSDNPDNPDNPDDPDSPDGASADAEAAAVGIFGT
ncbi:putative vancomycin resistance protein [Saccharomonospora marina XMU15]|uniref:Putative vancomycin resistance protein n=1 Tax=Saccharomonospora marina XMU15 TaxID=882083 RepID=H5X8R8_9PSEU|nr:VanW family protein [Saccharomonospora marina]EHR51437.1 putative vancomycin resistance protein [Saccharomonospora marina XMU15]